MSHYTRNHLQDDWAAEGAADIQTRVQDAEREAGWYFDRATQLQRAEFNATMRALLGTTGPRADRARDAAHARFRQSTAEARVLLETSINRLLESGELPAELDEQWTTLIQHNSRPAMAAE